MGRIWLLWGCILAFLYVALGAFGSHALAQILTDKDMNTLAIANRYLGFHAFALISLGLWNHWEKWSATLVPGLCFLLGSVLFSGSLYILVLAEIKKVAMITPIGGLLFMVGWTFFAITLIRTKNTIV